MYSARLLRQNSPIKLEEYLARKDFELAELFRVPNIISDIKSNFYRFVNYLKTRKGMIKQLIDLVTDVSQQQIEEQEDLKRCCFCATEVLSNDEDELMQLYFHLPDEGIIYEDIPDATEDFEKLLSYEPTVIISGEDYPAEGEILDHLLSYLKRVQPTNYALNGYYVRILNNIIRKKGLLFLGFLQSHYHYLDCITDSLRSPSMGALLVRILTIDDEKKYYPFESVKNSIVKKVAASYLSNIEFTDVCESLCMLIEDAFQSIKNRYFEFPEDFVRCLNYIVSEEAVNRLVDRYKEASPAAMENLSVMLGILMRKMNNEVEEFAQYQKERKESKPMTSYDFILKFELQPLTYRFSYLIQVLKGDSYKQAGYYSKQKLIDLLVYITKGPGLFASPGLQIDEIFDVLFEYFAGARAHGILRNSLFELLKTFVIKSPITNIEKLRLSDRKWLERNFPQVMENTEQQKTVNMDERYGHESHLLIELEKRLPNFFDYFEKDFGISLRQLKEKYNKPLAEYAKKNTYNEQDDDDDGIVLFRQSAVLSLGTQDIKGGVMVGRNKDIALPSLRYMSETKKVRIEVKTLDIELEKKLVTQIEEEEIVVTGDKLMEVEEDIEMVIPSGKITIQEKIPYFIPKSIPDTIPDTITDAIPTAIPGFIRDTIPDTIPTPYFIPDTIPYFIPEKIPEVIQRVSETVPEVVGASPRADPEPQDLYIVDLTTEKQSYAAAAYSIPIAKTLTISNGKQFTRIIDLTPVPLNTSNALVQFCCPHYRLL